ncbi:MULTISPECIES: hypothetical protein [unclassified Streptomyces]|uniref:hypothetical protein n=1 Tax=unclassified Streptomyces TaxID=2593676 RepID=UPI0007ED670C|nr:hypothetical protein [Streptomyces sp. H-KF8]OBQ51127.1 hypothetical protein A4U61_13545 [Streptomyces sp. H-KF8]
MVNSGRLRGGSGEWEKPFWQQRGWMLSAGFLATLLVVGVVALMSGGSGTPPRAGNDPTTTPSASPGTTGKADARPAGCRTDDSDQEKPTAVPKDFRWKANGTGLVPVSKTVGPLLYDGPVWYCYAHTPMGAVLAAHSVTDHFSYPGWRQVVERQVVPGAGRDALIADRSQAEDKPVSGKADAGGYAGFSVLAYNEEEATVMLLLRGPDTGVFGSASVTVRWHEGDWKLVPGTDGTVYSGMAQVSGTQGFVTWEA